MTPRSWTEIQSIVIDGQLALTKLVCGGPQSAIFETTDPESDGRPTYFVHLVRATGAQEAKQILNRLEEARFLNHPGVLQPLGVGVIDPENLVFCVTAKPLSVLAQAPGPMPLEEVRLFTVNLLSALAYLHLENLVFCNLRPEAVWKTENGWVLADFSQLRLIGAADPQELRQALVRFGDTPPEAYQGDVSPAWDIWSLGVLLQRVFTGDPGGSGGNASVSRARQLRKGLPEPFQQIVRECLDPNPESRPPLQKIEEILNAPEPPSRPAFEWTPRHLRSHDETSSPGSLREFFRAARLSWILIFVIGILGVGIWTFALTRKNESPPPPTPIAAAPEADRINSQSSPAATAAPSDPAVREILDKWIATARAKDLAGQMTLYAPVVDTYYKQRNIPRSRIASIKKRDFGSMGPVKKFDARNVQITQIDPSNAVVLFTKNWAFGRNSANSGSVRSQLTLRKIAGEWKVVAERELSAS